jgi:plasmid stabilization system protein ParE
LRFSKQEWGPKARNEYRASLRAAIEDLIRFPDMGFHDDLFPENVRILTVASHRIIYQATEQEVLIMRVVHCRQRMPKLDD